MFFIFILFYLFLMSSHAGAVEPMIDAGGGHTVALKSDGTIAAGGGNSFGQLEVGGWSDIIQVAARWFYTVGLKADGTVMVAGGLESGQLDVGGWRDIIQVAIGDAHIVGVKSDGTVVAVGNNERGQLEVEVDGWWDIIQVAAGDEHTVGLKADGTVVAVGYNYNDQLEVDGWRDIIQVAAGGNHTVGLSSDGRVVAAGFNYYGQGVFYDWNFFSGSSSGIEVSSTAYDFGDVRQGETGSTTVTISNMGKGILSISEITLNSEETVFTIDSTTSFPVSLTSGKGIEVDLSFTPSAVKSYTGTLAIQSNDGKKPLIEIPLSGKGVSEETPGCGF